MLGWFLYLVAVMRLGEHQALGYGTPRQVFDEVYQSTNPAREKTLAPTTGL